MCVWVCVSVVQKRQRMCIYTLEIKIINVNPCHGLTNIKIRK